jgi:phosphatidylserine/phosphatidylglycerophosphate/cardiolipin synthase-like enzyme
MKTHTHTIANWIAVSLALLVTPTLTPEDHSASSNVEYAAGLTTDAGAVDSVLEAINASRNQILVAIHSFTSRPVAKALADAHLRGVKVFVIADELEARKKYSVAGYLANRGLPVQLNDRDKIFPHNFLVVDDLTLELGSVNQYATQASKSVESVSWRLNVKFSSDPYTQEWNRLWDESVPLAKKY